jgi:hypothetical protein
MRRVLVVALLLSLTGSARAWNPHGHRVVAALAHARLQAPVQRRVEALLALNPEHARWVAGVAPADRAVAAFLRASNWADDIREAPDYRDEPSVPLAKGYPDRQMHKEWHYTNRPFSLDGTPTRPAPTPNVQTQIAQLRRLLSSPTTPDPLKSYALVWLIHLVGDVHMPLHCSARFDRQLPRGDRGGTLILLAGDQKDHLHGFWDRALGEHGNLGKARADARELPAATPALVAITDEARWVDEGFEAAKRWVYRPPVKAGPGPFTLDAAYARDARTVSAQRISLAGARLARLLNDALK